MQKIVKLLSGLCLALLAAPALADQWNVAETAHFRVYSKGSTTSLIERTAMLEDYRALLDMLTTRKPGAIAEPKLDIFLISDISEAAPFGKISKDIAGFYSPTSGRILAFAVEKGDDAQAFLLHEYAHHYMLGSPATVAYPGWYIEGFAEYFMTARFQPQRIEFGDGNLNRAKWLAYANWLPLEQVLSGDIKNSSGEAGAMYYAQSWLLTHYLLRTPELAPKLEAYLRAVAEGSDPVQAFKDKINPNLTQFQRLMQIYLKRKQLTTSAFNRPPKTPASVVVTPLSAASDPMLLQLASLERGVRKDSEAKALAKVRETAARFPGDPLAERTLAFAEMRHGDHAIAVEKLDRLIAANPTDATLLRWRGEAVWPFTGPIAAADIPTARKYFARAFKADPEDWRTLYLYAMLEDPYANKLKPQTLDVLLRAHQLAPQVNEIGMATAMALARADRLPEAVTKLEPIAFSPHGGSVGETAAALLPLARAGDAEAFIVGFDEIREEQKAAAATKAAEGTN